MAVSETTRFGITRWSAGTDAFTRTQMDQSHQRLEDSLLGWTTAAALPTPSASVKGFVNVAPTTGVVSYCDSTAWYEFLSLGNVIGLTPGAANSDGSSSASSRSDHVHSLPGWGTSAATLSGSSPQSGSASTFSRSDHKHAHSTSIPGSALTDNSLTVTRLGSDAANSRTMAASAVGSAELAAGVINASAMISSGSITTSNIVSLDAAKINNSGTAPISTTGNAATATKWKNPMTVSFYMNGSTVATLTGWDGSANKTINLGAKIVASNVPQLGLDNFTTGTVGGSGAYTFPSNLRMDRIQFGSSSNYLDYGGNNADLFTFVKSNSQALIIGTSGIAFPGFTYTNGEKVGNRVAFHADPVYKLVYVYVNGSQTAGNPINF